MKLILFSAFLFASIGLLLGCGPREHLGPNFGKQTRLILEQQPIFANAEKSSPKGLDSEEAAIIHANYRRQLSGDKGQDPKDSERVLLLQDEGDGKSQRRK